MRTALRAMGDLRAESLRAETRWRSTETRNEAARTDSVVKQRSSTATALNRATCQHRCC